MSTNTKVAAAAAAVKRNADEASFYAEMAAAGHLGLEFPVEMIRAQARAMIFWAGEMEKAAKE